MLNYIYSNRIRQGDEDTMKQFELGEKEEKFALIIWKNEPIASGELAKLALEKLNWKRTTTYTMLKRLCERKIFSNKNGTVISLMNKEEFYGRQGTEYINKSFGGSLPHFFAAFTRQQKLSDKDINDILKIINEHKEA